MSAWIISVIAAAVSTAVATIVTVTITRFFSIRFKKKDEAQLAAQQESEGRRHDDMVKVFKEEIAPISQSVNNVQEKLDKIGDGTLCSLRNDILTCYYRCATKGYRNDYDFKNIHDLFEAYKTLEGNSFIEDVMVRFDNLPTKEEFRDEQEEFKKKPNKLAPKVAKKKGE